MRSLEGFARRGEDLAERARRRLLDPSGRTPRSAQRTSLPYALWDAGLLGAALDPAYGGQGLTSAHHAILKEVVADYASRHSGRW